MDAVGLHYDVHEGSGPPLLLVHGMLASRAQWLPNLEALRRVCTPVVVELLGHGRSPSPEETKTYRPEGYVVAFERLRELLGLTRWAICGQSLGAALTLRYALDCPDRVIRHVFTNSNSALADPSWEEGVRTAMEAQARDLERDGHAAIDRWPVHPRNSRRIAAPLRDALVADCALHDPRGIGLTGLHTIPTSSCRARVAENRVPTLLVVGERETRFDPQRRVAEAELPGLEVVPTPAGHAVNLECADTFNAAVTEFLVR